MARKKRAAARAGPPKDTLAAPRLASAALVALCCLVAALAVRSGFARHATPSPGLGVGGLFVLASVLASLAFFAFVVAAWQWRLSARGSVRVLVATYLSLFVAFCGLCWHDVALAAARLPGAASALRQLRERTFAVMTTLGALAAGLVAVVVVVGVERRRVGRRQ